MLKQVRPVCSSDSELQTGVFFVGVFFFSSHSYTPDEEVRVISVAGDGYYTRHGFNVAVSTLTQLPAGSMSAMV